MTRFELNQYIKMLADRYPACFFENPRHRRPLKKKIIDDLRSQERSWNEASMNEALHAYTAHWGYLYSMSPGAWRVDLDGNQVERVTEQEAQDAYDRRVAEQREHYERRNGTVHPVLTDLHKRRIISDDAFSKVTIASRPQDSAQLAVNALKQARAGFGLALVDSASRLKTNFFRDEMMSLYGALSGEIGACLQAMEGLSSKLRDEQ